MLITILLAGTLLASDHVDRYRIQDRTGREIGEVRPYDRKRFDVYDRDGRRKAWGEERGGVIEFYDRKGRRLPFELRKER